MVIIDAELAARAADGTQRPLRLDATDALYVHDSAVLAKLADVVTAILAEQGTDVSALAKEVTLAAQTAVLAAIRDRATFPLPSAQLGVLTPLQPPSAYPLPAAQVTDLKTVTVTNPSTPTDVSALAKSLTQTDGTQKTQVTNFPATQPVSGPATDAQLRATPLPVSGTVTVANPTTSEDITDRAARLLGHVTVDNPTTNPETGLAKNLTLTDGTQKSQVTNFPTTQAVSAVALPLPTGAATDATVAGVTTSLGTDGAAPPAIPGVGVRGWLRGIYDRLSNPLAVTGTFFQGTQPVSGPITDAQARATPLPVSGTVATGGLTDTQLRTTPVPVSGSVSTGLAQPLTDTQLRTAPVPVTNASLPLPAGAATELTLGRRFGGSKLAYSAVITASTTDITPTVGKTLRLLWVAFVPNSDNASANLVQIGFVGGTAVYTGYALAHWERFDGPAINTALRITLANTQPVAVTVHYEEF